MAFRRLARVLPLLLVLLLTACGADTRQLEICRAALAALVDTAVLDRRDEGDPTHAVIRYRATAAQTDDHTIACTFAGDRFNSGKRDLIEVSLDGTTLSPVRLSLLHRALGLPTPQSLIVDRDAEKPLSLARQGAYFAQQMINGIQLGAVLALVAIGYSLVYGVTGTIQFAYGEFFMIGAFVTTTSFMALFIWAGATSPLFLVAAMPIGMAVAALYGWSAERIVYRPLLDALSFPGIIAAVGLSIALREFVRISQGSRAKWVPTLLHGRFELFDGDGFTVSISAVQILTIVVTIVLGTVLARIMATSRFGREFRACSDDVATARLLGVDVGRVVSRTFTLGAALAALSGAVVLLHYGQADFFMGYLFGFKALTAAILGGFGSLGGALLGGLLIGLLEALWAAYISNGYKDVAVFGVLALVLIFRPNGLLGIDIEGPRKRRG